MVRIMTLDEARGRCAEHYGLERDTSAAVTAESIYYAPPLAFQRARASSPTTPAAGRCSIPQGTRVDLLRVLLPAVQDGPQVDLDVTVEPRGAYTTDD